MKSIHTEAEAGSVAKALPAGRLLRPRARLASAKVLAVSPAALLISAWFFSAHAEEAPLPRTTFGAVGMVEMPTARMAPDGELSVSASYFKDTQRYSLGFQIFPWLETSFRYAGLQHFNTDYPVYYDRSFAMKMRLWNEDGIIPSVAVGINDLVGTGIYGSEYVVASKQFGDIDASIGLGWGRDSSANSIRNPLGAIASSFYTRDSFSGEGGNFNLKQYFHGPRSGIFGGVNWRTPVDGLTLSAEYSSDAYDTETARGSFHPDNQFNIGASYRPTNGITLGLDWLYGKSIGGTVSFQLDPTTQTYPQKIDSPPPVAPTPRSAEEQQMALAGMIRMPGKAWQPVKASAARRDTLVDTLWEAKDVTDIQLRGNTLLLTVNGTAADARCRDIMGAIRQSDDQIVTVRVRSGGGALLCQAHAAAPQLRNAAYSANLGATALDAGAMAPALLTIDASASSRRPDQDALAAIRRQAASQFIAIDAVAFVGSDAEIYYSNGHYFSEKDAINRLTAILMKESPPEIERFRIVTVRNGVPQREEDVLRSPQERQYLEKAEVNVFATDTGAYSMAAPMQNPVLAAEKSTYPKLSWSVYPQFRQELFDPSNPVGVQFLLAADAAVQLTDGLSVEAGLETSLYDDFNTNRSPDSSLPHVRTDFLKYFGQGKTGISDLQANYRFRLAPDVFAIARSGYLESMFAGVGGEVLWRPENQRWALGVDMYELWQRDFDRLFGLQPYHVLTGHLSLYYASPWYGLNFAIRAGRYLAGDRGVTFEMTRRFSTGIEVGAFFTRTNVPAAQFGEGSFDKGILIRIPLGWMLPIETQGQFAMDLRPIQRDGGQRMLGDTVLYDETRRASQAEIYNQINAPGSN